MTTRSACLGIRCPIGLYEKHNGEIRRLAQTINRSSTAAEMALGAHDLREHASALLNCRAYDENDVNCRICRELSAWRKKTASVVEQMVASP
jgi:hypothetical protein